MAAKQRLHELVAANAPVLYLHPDERFMPCSVEYFLQHSELQRLLPDNKHEVLIQRGQVTGAALMAAQRAAKGGDGLMLALDEGAKWGAAKAELDDVPLYVNAKEVVTADGKAEALELNYIMCFAHNGPYTVGGCFQVGAHDGDWEHFTVRVDAETGATVGAFFHTHRNQDGIWATAAAMPRCRDGSGRPAAYVALNGHGTYHVAGLQLRAGLVANDRTSDRGLLWRPRRCVLLHYVGGTWALAQPGSHPSNDRRLMQVPSRGTSLPPAAVAPAAGPAAAAAAAGNSASGAGAGPAGASNAPAAATVASAPSAATTTAGQATDAGAQPAGAAGPPADNPTATSPAAPTANPAAAAGGSPAAHPAARVQVTEGPAEWLGFTGRWGTPSAPAPITQKWFTNAEPPVSRTLLRRILHFPAEQRLGEKGC